MGPGSALIHLDTNAAIWMFEKALDRIPVAAQARVTAGLVAISPMVELELAYLYDLGKLDGPPRLLVEGLAASIDLRISSTPFAVVVKAAASLTWTRDPFDRLIAGQAIAEGATLLTADRRILANLANAAWD